jgi:hypothetical protein
MTWRIGSQKLKMAFIALGSIFFSFYLWGENLKAKWGVVDDHEIISFLGPSGSMSLARFPKLLMATEFSRPGISQRYRPSYYLLRLGETFFWGDSPFLWYSCRLLLFAVTVMILWWLFSKYVGLFAGMLLTMYIFTFHYWADIWTRLGPAETYAVFGTALYVAGFVRALEVIREGENLSRRWSLDWLLMLLGAIVAMGSKENFVILLVPTVVLLVILWKKRRLDITSMTASAVIGGFGVFISAAVSIALSKTHKDIYANSVEPVGRLELLFQGMGNVFSNGYFLAALIAIVASTAAVYLYLKQQGDRDRYLLLNRAVAKYFSASAVILFVYISQYAFYSGKWPADNRYDFPGGLCLPIFILVTAILLRDIGNVFTGSAYWRRCVSGLFSLLLCVLIIGRGYDPLRADSRVNSEKTQIFSNGMVKVAEILRNDPNSILLFVSSSAWDYEQVYSTALFLQNYGVTNPFYLYIYQHPKYATTGFEESLASQLLSLSRSGEKNKNFYPMGALDGTRPCYSISFSATQDVVGCRYLGRVYP